MYGSFGAKLDENGGCLNTLYLLVREVIMVELIFVITLEHYIIYR